jgi:hypothetical protein
VIISKVFDKLKIKDSGAKESPNQNKYNRREEIRSQGNKKSE